MAGKTLDDLLDDVILTLTHRGRTLRDLISIEFRQHPEFTEAEVKAAVNRLISANRLSASVEWERGAFRVVITNASEALPAAA